MPSSLDCARMTLADSLLAIGALLTVACQGEILSTPNPGGPTAPGSPGAGPGGTGAGGGGGSIEPAVFSPAPGAFKRLTTSEYLATLRDLLGEVSIGDLEPDTFLEGFAQVGSGAAAISLNGVEKYELAVDAAT